jgi:hypothetical protein
MEKPDLTPLVPTVEVMPRTLIIRPMAYRHPAGGEIFFSGVFGNDADSKGAGDVWVATFFDRQEAEAFVMGSKAFGQTVTGVRLGYSEESSIEKIAESPRVIN